MTFVVVVVVVVVVAAAAAAAAAAAVVVVVVVVVVVYFHLCIISLCIIPTVNFCNSLSHNLHYLLHILTASCTFKHLANV